MTSLGEPRQCSFLSDSLKLNYWDWGNPDAPTLVLVHGNRDHARTWDWTARALADRWHVVALDARGHGDSDWSPEGAYTMPFHIGDFTAFIDHLAVPDVTLVCHSYGGNIGSRYAALYPDRIAKLVLVDGLGPGFVVLGRWAEAGAVDRLRNWIDARRSHARTTQRVYATLSEMVARMAKANTRLTPEQAHHLAIHAARRQGDGWSWKFDPRVTVMTPDEYAVDPAQFWSRVEIPVLIFYGTESWSGDPEADGRAAHFRDHRTIIYPGAGHWVHHDRFDDFITALSDFL